MRAAEDWTNATPSQMFGHVLRPDELLSRATYGFAEPAAGLGPWVERYWSVQWAFAPGEVFRTATLDDPSLNLTLERGGVRRAGTDGAGSWVTGPVTRGRFDLELYGTGSVVGVKFHVGGIRAFADLDLPALRDTTVPAQDVFGRAVPLPALPDHAAAAAPQLDDWLRSRQPQEPEGLGRFRDVLDLLADPAVTSLAALEEATGTGARSLQRLFTRFAGVGPKRLLVRARVMDAVAAMDHGDPRPLARIAQDLGWFDQSHFIRDFRRITGETPAHYAQRGSISSVPPPA